MRGVHETTTQFGLSRLFRPTWSCEIRAEKWYTNLIYSIRRLDIGFTYVLVEGLNPCMLMHNTFKPPTESPDPSKLQVRFSFIRVFAKPSRLTPTLP